MDLPESAAAVVLACAEDVRRVAPVSAFYAGGSLATGDYHPGISDLDLVALVSKALDAEQEAAVQRVHETLIRRWPLAAQLHCCYVPVPEVDDVTRPHLYWAHGELYRRRLSAVARADVLRHGITVFGPPAQQLIPAVSNDELAVAARAELSDYWVAAVAKPDLWLEDVYVDIGLTTLARVEATLTDGQLITKSEALSTLGRFGVPSTLIREMEQRRRGLATPMTHEARQRRADQVRELMTAGMERLLRG